MIELVAQLYAGDFSDAIGESGYSLYKTYSIYRSTLVHKGGGWIWTPYLGNRRAHQNHYMDHNNIFE